MEKISFIPTKKSFQLIPLGLVLIISMASVVHADDAPKSENISFSDFDVNKDGVVSIKEAAVLGMPAKAFEAADANVDGYLDQNEFSHLASAHKPLKDSSLDDDKKVTAKVKSELQNNVVLKGIAVNVETYKGIVHLSGFVDSRNKQLAIAQIATAGQLAASVDGVTQVINGLVLLS